MDDTQDDQARDDQLDSQMPANPASDNPIDQEPTDQDLDLIDKEDKKHEEVKPPSVVGEEDPMSGDATSSESPDIDDELSKVGLTGDNDGIKPLGVEEELNEEAV